MKKVYSILIAFIIAATSLLPLHAENVTNAPSRVINIVYDDSGSMYIGDNDVLLDTWCQAKYSMEVFAAMLGDKDTMNVYYISDYVNDTSAGPRISLNGKDGAATNVAKIHNEKTHAVSTPFNAVMKAYSDLVGTKADDKWLVILTDGAFQEGNSDAAVDVDGYLAQKPADIKVMFLGIGKDAQGIQEKQDQNIFCVRASTSNQILTNITDICTRVFNSNKLEVNTAQKDISFDIPMGELIVFAQGANVEINGIKKEDGTLIKSSLTPVEVKYSASDADNYQSNQPELSLLGKIATFKDDFDPGKYTIDVSGAETIEVYYKPNVEVAAYLTDDEGNSVSDLSALSAGTYKINFGFVKGGTSEPVEQSKLLGKINYSAVVTNNDVKQEKVYSDGDKISIEEGQLQIDVKASYLDYNSVSTALNYTVYKDKTITYTLLNNPNYEVIDNGLEKDDDITIQAQIDGHEFTQEQWDELEVPMIDLAGDHDYRLEMSQVEKTEQIGVLKMKPVLPDGKPTGGQYSDTDYKLVSRQKVGEEAWIGSMDGTLKVHDSRSWFMQYLDKIIKYSIIGLIIFMLLGYTPLFKNYLPKSLQSRPLIECEPDEPGQDPKMRTGTITKVWWTYVFPFLDHRAVIEYVTGVSGCPNLKVKAIKRRRMTFKNLREFENKDYITFDGKSIEKEDRKFETGGGVSIVVYKDGWTYTCSPNKSRSRS